MKVYILAKEKRSDHLQTVRNNSREIYSTCQTNTKRSFQLRKKSKLYSNVLWIEFWFHKNKSSLWLGHLLHFYYFLKILRLIYIILIFSKKINTTNV